MDFGYYSVKGRHMGEKLEKMEGLLSVIIPIYNIKPYLARCIESVLSQTYLHLEIIIVDDGSTDGSEEVCRNYQDRSDRITYLRMKHGGTSRARNLGMQYAKGEYIGFVDGDDFIDSDMYESMLREMKEDVDIVTCGRYIDFPSERHMHQTFLYTSQRSAKYSNTEAMEEMLKTQIFSFSVCDKVFRRKLFDNVLFPEGRTCEDLPVAYTLFVKSRSVVHSGKPKYHNYRREDSSSRREFYYRRVDEALYAGDIYKDVSERYPHLTMQAEALYVAYLVHTIRCIRNCTHRAAYRKVEKRLIKALLHMSVRIICNPCITSNTEQEYFSVLFSI